MVRELQSSFSLLDADAWYTSLIGRERSQFTTGSNPIREKKKSISSISFSVIVVEDRSGLQAGQSAAVSPLYTDYYWLQKLTELYFSCYRTKEIKPLFHLFPLFPFGHRYRKYQNRNSRALFCVRPAITLRPIKGVHPHFENHWHRPRPWWMLPVHQVVIMMNEKTNSSTNC